MNPLISIIVPVYNVEKYLDRCVESIVDQTYKDLEIILVDDGSPDNCPVMCDRWAQRDNRIKVIHKKNGGLSSARNAGIDICQGEFVYFIDSDDEIKNITIEELYNTAIQHNCDMVMGRYLRVYENDSSIKRVNSQPEFTNKTILFDEDEFWKYCYNFTSKGSTYEIVVNMIVSCNKLIKKCIFDDLRFENGKFHEDEFIIHQLVGKCSKIALVDKYYYTYYQIQTSITLNKPTKPRIEKFESRVKRIEYFADKNKAYTVDAFVDSFGDFSYYLVNYQHSDRELYKQLKQMYIHIYKLSKPYFYRISRVKRIYYTSLVYSTFIFRILRMLSKFAKKEL